MITDQVISIKWATAINEFAIEKAEDLETLAEFRLWYTKASKISDVPQPYRGWVENGLPPKHKRNQTVTDTISAKALTTGTED